MKTVVTMKDTFSGRKAYKAIKKLGKLEIEFDFLQRVTWINNKALLKPEQMFLLGDPAMIICGLYILKDYVKTFTLEDVDD